MKTRSIKRHRQTGDSMYSDLPSDILFCVLCILDIKNMYRLKLVSNDYNKKISELLNNPGIWKTKAMMSLSPDQIEGITDYKDLLFNRQLLEKSLKYELDNSKYSKPSSFGLFSLSKESNYIIKACGIEFSLELIHPLLLNDESDALFAKVSNFAKLIPYLYAESIDKTSIIHAASQIEKFENKTFCIGDLNFIGLLPSIMKIRAVKCFELFIRAYLILMSTFNTEISVTKLSFDTVSRVIFSHQDTHLINKFIDLTMKLCDADSPLIHQIIKHAFEYTYAGEIVQGLRNMHDKKMADIIKNCKKYDIYNQLLIELFPNDNKEFKKYNLRASLEQALDILSNNHPITVIELIEMQNKIHTTFDKLIELQNNVENCDYQRLRLSL